MSKKQYQHLGILIVKYFMRNKRRTFRAILILGIGLSLILSTHMLMSGFLLQIQDFASLIDSSGNTIYLQDDLITDEVFDNLVKDLENLEIFEYTELRQEIIEISYEGVNQSVVITQANLQKLLNWEWISISADIDTSTLYLSDKSQYINDTTLFTGLPSGNISLSNFRILSEISSDILVDSKNNLIENLVIRQVAIKIFDQNQVSKLNNLADKYNLEMVSKEPSNLFLEITADQITWILILLQFALSFLLILSIFYVMITLVTESAPDLRVLHMIGYGKQRIFLLFLGQSLLVSIISVVVAFLFSMFFLQTILPLLTFLKLPYSIIFVDLGFLGITTIQAILVGLIAGLYPAKIGAEYYG